jgi:hypothetical protein
MSKPLSNRLDKLEAEALHSAPANQDLHIFLSVINPDGTVHKVLETIIKDDVGIRDDCVGASLKL